jgi:hypothetical protein
MKYLAPVLLILPLIARGASAADTSYDLFHPVPESEMRDFTTDRPTKSNSPTTVDAGHFQYESDLVNWSYDRSNYSGTTTSNLLLFDPTLKLGLTQNSDFELALAPMNLNRATNRTAGTTTSLFGFGDVYARVKYNLMGNGGGDLGLAVVPYVKAPTASRGIGNNHWEGGIYAPLSVALPDGWTMTLQSELDFLQNTALDGTHQNYQNLINFGHEVVKDVTGYAEFWSDVNTDRNAPTQYTLDFAAAWLVRANVQLDAGINIGLNKAATDYQPYLGLSQRF